MKHGYLIDMDGVRYRGSKLISGADYFIQQLRRRGIPFKFLTNNSQRTRRDMVAKLIATNLDPNCPTRNGLRPGCGAMVAMLETATGAKAFSVGKPSPIMMRTARKELGLATAETTMIGDTMETDILGGVQLGLHTVLVLSRGTKKEDLSRCAYQPEIVVDSLAEPAQIPDRHEWRPQWSIAEKVRSRSVARPPAFKAS